MLKYPKMKRKQIIDFLTLVLFFGIILSLTIYVGIGALIGEIGDENNNEIEVIMRHKDQFAAASEFIEHQKKEAV